MAEQSPVDPSYISAEQAEARKNLAVLLGSSLHLPEDAIVLAVSNLTTHFSHMEQSEVQQFAEKVHEVASILGPLATQATHNTEPNSERFVEINTRLNEENNRLVREEYGDFARTLTLLPHGQVDIDGKVTPLKPPKGADISDARKELLGVFIDTRGGYVKLSDIRERVTSQLSSSTPVYLSEHLLDSRGNPVIEVLKKHSRLIYYRFSPDVVVIDAQGRDPVNPEEIPTIIHRDPFAVAAPRKRPPKQSNKANNVVVLPVTVEAPQPQGSHVQSPTYKLEYQTSVEPSETALYGALMTLGESFGLDKHELRALRYHFDDTPLPAPRHHQTDEIIADVAAAYDIAKDFHNTHLSDDEDAIMQKLLGILPDTIPMRLTEMLVADGPEARELTTGAVNKLIAARQQLRDSSQMTGIV